MDDHRDRTACLMGRARTSGSRTVHRAAAASSSRASAASCVLLLLPIFLRRAGSSVIALGPFTMSAARADSHSQTGP